MFVCGGGFNVCSCTGLALLYPYVHLHCAYSINPILYKGFSPNLAHEAICRTHVDFKVNVTLEGQGHW